MGQTIFHDSVVALSSGRLPTGVAVVRISGPHSRYVLEMLTGSVPPERRACYRKLTDRSGDILDRGVVIFFAGPNSFTGEDVAEFQLHGGAAVVAAVLSELTGVDGVRYAEAGEFTRRAFMNGKHDLVETEALSDLIKAETEGQRRFALASADGAQSALYMHWRDRLTYIRAMVEARIDFADEGDVVETSVDVFVDGIKELVDEIDAHTRGYGAAEIIREGFEVVILGAPNAGKSSLFNALAQRDVAIVNEEAGTTRDLLEVNLDVGGIKINITDTAGIRHDAGVVEAIGIAKAKDRAKEADLILVLKDMNDSAHFETDWISAATLAIGTKSDLFTTPSNRNNAFGNYDLCVSSKTGEGLAVLIEELGRQANERIKCAGPILPFRVRHIEFLADAKAHMLKAAELESGCEPELVAEELRLAGDRLGRIVGAVDVEDLLDVVFSEFCIGK